MADNIEVTPGSGKTIAADDISGVLHQRVKVGWGVDGSAVDASATDPLPTTTTGNIANDTADSGNPVKVGGRAVSAAPTPVTAGDRADFTTDLFGSQRTLIVDPAGAALDYTVPALVEGAATSGSSVGTIKPLINGGRGSTTNPTPVTDGQIARLMLDKIGRSVTAPHQARDLVAEVTATITGSTSAADLVAATASTFNDIISVTLVNSGSSGSVVQIFDPDDTTVRWTGYCPPTDMRGIVFPVPLKQLAANTKWRWKTVTATSSMIATVQIVKNI